MVGGELGPWMAAQGTQGIQRLDSIDFNVQELSNLSVPTRKRRLLAVMFTDMKGFSDLAALDEDAALDTLRSHNQIMKPLVSTYRGTVLKTIGDSVMGKFSAASDALDCALEMQLRLKRWNIARPRHKQMRVRIGVHVGDVVVVKNDIFGVVTNLAKRLESVSPAGHVCCTDAARLMVLHLPRYKFKSSGSWKPKGARREIEFYSVALARDYR